MTVYQTESQNPTSIRIGSAKIEIGTSSSDAVNVGIADSIAFKEAFKPLSLKPDNSTEIVKGVTEHTATVSYNMWELDLTKLALMRGGLDTTGSVAGTLTTVTDEPHTLTGTSIAWLDNKNGAGTEVGSIVVTDASGNAAVRNTDYVVVVSPDGKTGIARVSSSTVITSGEGILVDYSYTPYASKSLSTGGLDTFDGRYLRITNTNAAGKRFIIEVYKARLTSGLDLSFNSDDEAKADVSKIEFEGIYDLTRTAGDQLFKITDEQGVL